MPQLTPEQEARLAASQTPEILARIRAQVEASAEPDPDIREARLLALSLDIRLDGEEELPEIHALIITRVLPQTTRMFRDGTLPTSPKAVRGMYELARLILDERTNR